tara:strand:- start:276 stop:1577 length:1302 start_codon:yes stop_codon:yes gene_type:complete
MIKFKAWFNLVPLSFLGISFLFIFSCEESEEVMNSDKYGLLSGTFHQEYEPDVKSFIFVSDYNGNVLADTVFNNTGDDQFVFYMPEDFENDKITLTVGTQLEDGSLRLETNTNIAVGSELHFYNPYRDEPTSSIGSSYLSLSNIPDYDRFRINTQGLPGDEPKEEGGYDVFHYFENDDILLMFTFDDGSAGYYVVENVQVGDTNTVDLLNGAALTTAEHVEVPNNTGLPYAYRNHYGFAATGSYIQSNILARLISSSSTDYSNDNFVINYPSAITQRFRFEGVVGDGWNTPGGKQFRQRTVGDLPSSIEKLDADIISFDISDSRYSINATGSFDQWGFELQNINETSGSINARWIFYNNSDSLTISRPEIPSSVLSEYSVLNDISFSQYGTIRVIDWFCADNYRQWTNLYFSNDAYYLDYCSGFRELNYWPPE